MPTLRIRFPAGRYHATPWGHHVNEGLIEWPPSPWRLLRALLAAGYGALHWPADGPPDAARSLILKLASTLPRYGLPPASGAHSRHYMPLARLDGGREKTTLVIDTWASVGDGELLVQWDAALTPEERGQLARLASCLGYLGRSESWAEAELLDVDLPFPADDVCYPCGADGSPGPGWEQISMLAPLPDAQYAQWRSQAVASALAGIPVADASGKKLTKADRQAIERRHKAEASFPANVLACMQVTTDWLRAHGWNQPPGSQKVFYWRPADALEVAAPIGKRQLRKAPAVEAVLLSMSTASGNDHVLPTVYRSLPQAELLHRALVQASSRISGVPHPVLRGCDDAGRPLAGPHRHAHVVPLDLDGDGHLEHMLIWAPAGLDAQAQAAIRGVRTTFTKGAIAPLRLAIEAVGSLQSLADLPEGVGERLRRLLAAQGATEWISVTPFFAPRYIKKQGRNGLQEQARAELASRQLPAPRSIEVLDLHDSPEWMAFRHFVHVRRKGPQPPARLPFALRLQFDSPICGPVCLGYGSHFGLGLFGAWQS